jgi:DNA-binding transcriptional ArsR family regulator
MGSSSGTTRAKGLPALVPDVRVDVDWGTGYELVLGLRMLVDRDEDPDSYALGPAWFDDVRSTLRADTLAAIERYSGGHEILFGYLLALAADASPPRDGRALVKALEAVSPLDLRTLLLGGRLSTYRGRIPPEIVTAAADGDAVAARALLDGCLDWQREPYEHVLSLDADEAKSLLLDACTAWYAAVLEPKERAIARVLRRSARGTASLAERLRPPDLVDTVTRGVRYTPEPGIDRVLLVPNVVSRPWSIFTESSGTKILCYGVDESQVTGTAPPDPLVAAYKALGDGTRLRILRRLADGPATLNELTELVGLAKSTVHGHLLVLRTGGLVVAETSKRAGYALRRETLAASAALLDTYLGETEE